MKRKTAILWITGFIFLLTACSKSNEATESGNGGNNNGCDTVNMKFAANIVPLLQGNCYACHSNANMAISGISLEGYNNVKTKINDGRLWGAVNHASGFSPMPQAGAKLSDCNINKIKNWIDRGALNN